MKRDFVIVVNDNGELKTIKSTEIGEFEEVMLGIMISNILDHKDSAAEISKLIL